MAELHHVAALATSRTLELRAVVGNLRQGDRAADADLTARQDVLSDDLPALASQVTRDFADELGRNRDLNADDRLEQNRLALVERLLEDGAAGDLEGDVLAVHRVRFAVDQRRP